MSRRRKGMVMVTIIAVVSLMAILAVATLSLTSRLQQGSALAVRGASLDGAAAFGLGSVVIEWRSRSIGNSSIGGTNQFAVDVAGLPISVQVSVTRISREIFWAVAEARAVDGSIRRENLILRQRMPNADSVVAQDSSNVLELGSVVIDSIAGAADLILPTGSLWSAESGVVHAVGNLTISGGTGEGILIVEGTLSIVGPLEYFGLIIARGGIEVSGPGATLTGAFRAAGGPISLAGLTMNRSPLAVQTVLSKSLMPIGVAGRRWSEMY